MTQVFLLPVTPTFTSHDDNLKTYLPPKRVNRLMRYVQESDKKNCLFNYLMVKYCISIYKNIDANSLQFSLDNTNKPILLSHPEIHFNSSHTKGFICCVISDSPCGIDVEATNNQAPDILDIAFTESEKNYLNNFHEDDTLYNNNFYKIWTLKEAYIKALGTGLFEDISKINTFDDHYVKNTFTICVGNYIISVYSQKSEPNNIIVLSEDIIYNYFQ